MSVINASGVGGGVLRLERLAVRGMVVGVVVVVVMVVRGRRGGGVLRLERLAVRGMVVGVVVVVVMVVRGRRGGGVLRLERLAVRGMVVGVVVVVVTVVRGRRFLCRLLLTTSNRHNVVKMTSSPAMHPAATIHHVTSMTLLVLYNAERRLMMSTACADRECDAVSLTKICSVVCDVSLGVPASLTAITTLYVTA